MALYAIGDTHLSLGTDKSMEVFGGDWTGYVDKLRNGFSQINGDDVVVLCGDLSWGMSLEEAQEDFRFLAQELPGEKWLIKGNHDYWWSAIGRVRRALPEGMYAIQNDVIAMDGMLFAGSRGWTIPMAGTDEGDVRIYNRERMRLEMSLRAARARDASAPLIAMMHYPPLTEALAAICSRVSSSEKCSCIKRSMALIRSAAACSLAERA